MTETPIRESPPVCMFCSEEKEKVSVIEACSLSPRAFLSLKKYASRCVSKCGNTDFSSLRDFPAAKLPVVNA